MKELAVVNGQYKIRYHDFPGEKTPIIFIHGLGCAGSLDYPEVAAQPELCTHRRIIIDLLGAGFSDKPNSFDYTIENHALYLIEFIKALELEKIILFGHSIGGAVALTVASLYKGEVENVILTEANLDSGGGFITKKIASTTLKEFINTGFNNIIIENLQSANEIWVSSFSLWLPQAAYQISKSVVIGQSPSWRSILYSLECPKTYIFGEYNLDDPDVDRLKNNNVRIDSVRNAGHSMAWENPKGLANAIKKAL